MKSRAGIALGLGLLICGATMLCGCYPHTCAPNDTSCLPCSDIHSTNETCTDWPNDDNVIPLGVSPQEAQAARHAAWRRHNARVAGRLSCAARAPGSNEVCYDAAGITMTGCVWTNAGGETPALHALDAKIIAGSCGEPEFKACPVPRPADGGADH